jgi:hypothetical protein
MTGDVLVTLDVRRVRPAAVPALVAGGRRAVTDSRRDPRVRLAKLLATTGDRFVPRDLRPTRWALLTARTDGRATAPWAPHGEAATLQLRPLSGYGGWDGRRLLDAELAASWTGPVAVLTRATLRARHVRRFYAAVPAVARDIAAADGLRVAFGIGESPWLRQGTVSVWDSAAAVSAFLRGSAAHGSAVRRTPQVGWYAEELFARLAVVHGSGSIDGVSMAT